MSKFLEVKVSLVFWTLHYSQLEHFYSLDWHETLLFKSAVHKMNNGVKISVSSFFDLQSSLFISGALLSEFSNYGYCLQLQGF